LFLALLTALAFGQTDGKASQIAARDLAKLRQIKKRFALPTYVPAGFKVKQFTIENPKDPVMLTWTVPSFWKRVGLATLIGLAAWLSINVSYWDWYRFPANFVASELLEQIVGWGLSGAAMAMILRNMVSGRFN